MLEVLKALMFVSSLIWVGLICRHYLERQLETAIATVDNSRTAGSVILERNTVSIAVRDAFHHNRSI